MRKKLLAVLCVSIFIISVTACFLISSVLKKDVLAESNIKNTAQVETILSTIQKDLDTKISEPQLLERFSKIMSYFL